MATYKVLGEEGAKLEIPGVETPVEVGQTVELEPEAAAELVSAGKLEEVTA